MLDTYAHRFIMLMEMLDAFGSFLPTHAYSSDQLLGKRLENIRRYVYEIRDLAAQLAMPVTLATCDEIIEDSRMLELVPADRLGVRLASKIVELTNNVKRELGAVKFKCVARDRLTYYEENQFPPEVVSAFPDEYDMREAGRCFAFGLYTGCACHLMRVAELGIRKIESAYALKDFKSWGQFLTELRAHAYTYLKTDPQKKDRIMSLYARIESIKEAWRDDTMHVVRRYNEEESREVFDAVKNFMMFISVNLP